MTKVTYQIVSILAVKCTGVDDMVCSVLCITVAALAGLPSFDKVKIPIALRPAVGSGFCKEDALFPR